MCVRVSHIVRAKFKWSVSFGEVGTERFFILIRRILTRAHTKHWATVLKLLNVFDLFDSKCSCLRACAGACVCVGGLFYQPSFHQYYIWLIQHFYINLVTQEISVKMCALTITRLYHAICLSFKVTRQMLEITFECVLVNVKHLKLCLHANRTHPPASRCPFRDNLFSLILSFTLRHIQKFWIIFVFCVRVYFFRRHRLRLRLLLLLHLHLVLSTSFKYLTFTVKHFHFTPNYGKHTDNSRNFLLRCVWVQCYPVVWVFFSFYPTSRWFGLAMATKEACTHRHTPVHLKFAASCAFSAVINHYFLRNLNSFNTGI